VRQRLIVLDAELESQVQRLVRRQIQRRIVKGLGRFPQLIALFYLSTINWVR